MKTDNRVLYFSLNPESVTNFYECLNNTRLDCQDSFRAIDREWVFDNDTALKFKHASDILYFLNAYGENGDLGYLYVIIDYPSFFNVNNYVSFLELEKTNEVDSFSVKDAAKTIRRAILQYPEVFFMFDESWDAENETPNYPSFLFYFEEKKYISNVWTDYHKYAIKRGENPFDAILRGRTSLFDGSNLRHALKRYEYDVLKVERYNFSLSQDSRAKSLAICIEEERTQNRFNSYVLYSNGYRVLPVFSSKELKYVNENAAILSPKLIVRDYDLQFPDVDDKETLVTIQPKESYTIHTIDYIRGAKYIKENDNIWIKNHPEEQPKEDELRYLNKWHVLPYSAEHSYWDKIQNINNIKIFFVSKGVGDRIRLFSSTAECERKRKSQLKKHKIIATNSVSPFVDGVDCQFVNGTTKPISGLYTTFQHSEIIKEQYDLFRIESKQQFEKTYVKKKRNELDKVDKRIEEVLNDVQLPEKEKNEEVSRLTEGKKQIEKTQDWYINTSRENHEHGVPLDIYDSIRNMLERARKYYDKGKYIRSAIVSSEIIELLNGFHEALVLQAYHILAISENALAMNTIGGNEEELSLDASFRITKIANEVERLIDREKEECEKFRFNLLNKIYSVCMTLFIERDNRRKFKYNVLNQIYSECRIFCKEREHFEAEDRFISAMAHVNEGYKYKDILDDVKDIVLNCVSVIRHFIYTIKPC